MTTPAVYADHVWQKFEAFEGILSKEMTAGRHGDRYASLQYRCRSGSPRRLGLHHGEHGHRRR
jgi:hypothetical protein